MAYRGDRFLSCRKWNTRNRRINNPVLISLKKAMKKFCTLETGIYWIKDFHLQEWLTSYVLSRTNWGALKSGDFVFKKKQVFNEIRSKCCYVTYTLRLDFSWIDSAGQAAFPGLKVWAKVNNVRLCCLYHRVIAVHRYSFISLSVPPCSPYGFIWAH